MLKAKYKFNFINKYLREYVLDGLIIQCYKLKSTYAVVIPKYKIIKEFKFSQKKLKDLFILEHLDGLLPLVKEPCKTNMNKFEYSNYEGNLPHSLRTVISDGVSVRPYECLKVELLNIALNKSGFSLIIKHYRKILSTTLDEQLEQYIYNYTCVPKVEPYYSFIHKYHYLGENTSWFENLLYLLISSFKSDKSYIVEIENLDFCNFIWWGVKPTNL